MKPAPCSRRMGSSRSTCAGSLTAAHANGLLRQYTSNRWTWQKPPQSIRPLRSHTSVHERTVRGRLIFGPSRSGLNWLTQHISWADNQIADQPWRDTARPHGWRARSVTWGFSVEHWTDPVDPHEEFLINASLLLCFRRGMVSRTVTTIGDVCKPNAISRSPVDALPDRRRRPRLSPPTARSVVQSNSVQNIVGTVATSQVLGAGRTDRVQRQGSSR
jgi:hypothetical protein